MTSKERVQTILNHKNADRIAVDFGSTAVTGIHCRVIENLRNHYGLPYKPVTIIDPFQMLGQVDEELKQIIGIDCENVFGSQDIIGNDATKLHEQTTPWGQKVLITTDIDMTTDAKGDIYAYPSGDHSYPPSVVMPNGCYFMNAIERDQPIDDDKLNPADNLEEYGYISDADLDFLSTKVDAAAATSRAVVASFGGAALGDIAFIPGMSLREPKGIRSVVEWYMSTAMRQDYIHEIFAKQTDIAIDNFSKLWNRVGSKVDVVFNCGTDFGSQESQFCSADTFDELWLPHYRRMNDWIHANTTWKVMKHSCGAILPLIPGLINAGFDILNPVQINAKNMDPQMLKDTFGKQVTFWGGGADTQQILPFGTPQEVAAHVEKQCEIMGKNGGFVFNTVHNVQANVPTENMVAMIETLQKIRQ